MLDVKKKKRRPLRHGRLLLILLALALLAGAVGAAILLQRPEEIALEEPAEHAGTLASYQAEDVQRLAITLRRESWAATQSGGALVLEDDPDYQIARSASDALLDAVRVIAYEDVLTAEPDDYADHLADFGLEEPRVVADVTFTDGARWVLRIGDAIALEDTNAYYMLIDGDPRLFALDKGTAESLMVERSLLHPVEQPVLHKARFDRISFLNEDGSVAARWELQGKIGGNAQDRWLLTEPLRYPVDGEAIEGLLDNLANLRLGAYVGEATPENLSACGFDTPRFGLEVHQAPGAIGTAGLDGVYGVTDWPESTFTLTVGGARSDMVDYVLVDGSIYLSSHFTLAVFMDADPVDTLSRYTVPVALGNLAGLTIRDAQGERVYTLERTEQIAENNALLTDAQGNLLYDVACTLNGEKIPYAGFESAYNDLLKVTVSGRLPTGWAAGEAPHTAYVFRAVTGEEYTLELARFDAMHDAVILDGNALYYLIRGGMSFSAE